MSLFNKPSIRSLPTSSKLILSFCFLFGIIGLFFTIVFFGMQLDIFRVAGATSVRDDALGIHSVPTPEATTHRRSMELVCLIHSLNTYAPDTARAISVVYENNKDTVLVAKMLEISSRRFMDNESFINDFRECDLNPFINASSIPKRSTAYAWADSAEWSTLTTALKRDQDTILRVSEQIDLSPRLIIAGVIGEQFRFFSGVRTAFKNYFEPLKIFGRLSKFSYGIAGLKPDTFRSIEDHLSNLKSAYYLGDKYQNLIEYSEKELSTNEDPQLARITDPNDNYYSYLYVGLYMKQVIAQWEKAGYDISENPGVLATLYNLGFNRSIPKENPRPGGAEITINETRYTFGQIGEEFYYSGELLEEFPY